MPCAYIISTIFYPRLKAILSTSLVFYQQIYDHLILTTGQWPANTHTHTHTLTQTDAHSASLTPCFVFVGTTLYAPQIHTKWEPGWLSLTYHYLPYPPLLIIPLTLTTELLTFNNHSIRLPLLVLLYCTSYPPINILIKSLLNIYRGCRLRAH